MKRDMELIRLLLLQREADPEPGPDLSHYSVKEQVFHGALVVEAGLVHGSVLIDQEGQPKGVIMLRLTWAGYDFLEAAKNEGVWNKAKRTIAEKGLTVTFDIMSELLKSIIKSQLGI